MEFDDSPSFSILNWHHYWHRPQRGTHVALASLGIEVAALLYGLFESAKLTGVEPATYIRETTRRAVASPGTITLPRTLIE